MLQTLTAVSVDLPRGRIDALLERLETTPFAATAYEDVLQDAGRVEIFLEESAQAPEAVAALIAAGAALGVTLTPVVRPLPPQDWAESWKRFFHVLRVSGRVVIRPTWEPYAAAPGECVIDLDPGMSFGTGQHGTTRACLAFIDRYAAAHNGVSMLDMGCGSGILAIAAAKLGLTPVHAFDNDADAVAIARENAALNRVEIAFDTCDLAANRRQAELVAANILAPVLIDQADAIAAAVRPGGALILSGILDSQYAGVREVFTARGFSERENTLIDEWRSGFFQR
jgi:ribosomal protein L11 methyltransferase